MIRDTYMTTGEFARLMKISKYTLFHYDEIGLFCPEILGDNGYRYYSIYQMETLDTILLLKKAGMSLQEIKDFLENRSMDRFISIFDTKEQEIDKEIRRLQSMKKWMHQRKKKIQYVQKCDFSEVGILHQPERYYFYEDIKEATEKEAFMKANALICRLEELNGECDYDVAYMQYPGEIEQEIYNAYHNVLLLMSKKIKASGIRILPEGDYLTAYHVGHWETVGEAYQRLDAYRKAKGIETEGNYLEYYVVDNFTVKDMEDYVTEISIKVAEKDCRAE